MKIAVALSGGVDSSTTAYLLKQAGHDIFGLFMKNWEEKDSDRHCLAEKDYEEVVRTCAILDIPYYGVNFAKEYWTQVFEQFLKELKCGYTPNPDILCNREIKFNVLYKKALALGAEALATGHYCRTEKGTLLKGIDPGKDQSYFLYTLKKNILDQVLFPIGDQHKIKVRALAKKGGLPVHNKKDSTGICFIGKRHFKTFLEQYLPHEEGVIETVDGKVIGTHLGAMYYTIGQRKGLEIGGRGAPWFVVGKEMKRRALIVAQGKDHPALFSYRLTAQEISWIGEAPSLPLKCRAKIRYRQADQPCTVKQGELGQLCVCFETPQRAITPRQSIVFYLGDQCLGGAMIEKAGPSLYPHFK